jgi:hypothetical protein
MGAAWYKRRVTIPQDWAGKQVWLKIGAVHAQGWFWVNGTYLNHDDCYCGTYKYNITDLVQPGREAVIVAKVRNDVPSGKGCCAWMARFGGLYRDVEIEATPDISIDYAYVDGDLDRQNAVVHVKLRSLAASPPQSCEVAVVASTLDGRQAGRAAAKVAIRGRQAKDEVIEVPLDPLQPWSPEHPNLYKAEIVLILDGKAGDGWIERFGVRKWEVRGGDFYLNNHKHFVRGFGDDSICPLTICPPASREEHRKHLTLAKEYGFTYVRHHTHCEVPEFYDACDELGIMVQPELPYYGPIPSAGQGGVFRPKDDLRELVTHFRRHVSLSTYCTGNEGWMGSPLDAEIYRLAKELDPTRLAQHQDGGKNTADNSDFQHGRPWFHHEYLNLAVDADPRLAPRYTGGQQPPVSPEAFQRKLESVGLPLRWGHACLDAGHQLQRIYQKQGLERARLDPGCGGYIYWTIVDVGFSGDQGLLDQFWQPKASTPEIFRQFNGPTAVLAKIAPAERILAAGDELKAEWWISHFGEEPLRGKTLDWKLTAGDTVIQSGTIAGLSAETGEVKAVGRTACRVPPLAQPVRARLAASLGGVNTENAWDVWLFPQRAPRSGADLAAAPGIHESLAKRYPGLTVVGSPAAAQAKVVLTTVLDSAACDALKDGKAVILLRLRGPSPGVQVSWWVQGPQTGTAVARHPAFGGFPHEGYLNELLFPILGSTVKAGHPSFRSVEPLMVSAGQLGYLIHVFQAKAGRGKVLGSGLHLLSDRPEAAWLLDEFIQYVQSDRFVPTGTLDIERALRDWELMKVLNGWSRTTTTFHRTVYRSFLGELPMCVARQSGIEKLLTWNTQPVPKDLDPAATFTFQWVAGLGWISAKPGKFTLALGDRPLVDFDVVQKTTTWTGSDGTVALKYTARDAVDLDSSGIMELTLPAKLLTPGQPAELRVIPAQTGSSRWFAVYEYP